MTTDVISQYTLLHLLKVKGFASAESVAVSVGADVESVEPLLAQAVTDELAKLRTGRLSGYALTPAGRARHAELHSSALSADEQEYISVAYEEFLEPNRKFKQLTTDWQLSEDKSDPGPVLAQLGAIDESVGYVVQTAADGERRFVHYRTRFTAALERLRAGDDSAFARPMSDSYHDVWMELHEDLLATLGRERTDADE